MNLFALAAFFFCSFCVLPARAEQAAAEPLHDHVCANGDPYYGGPIDGQADVDSQIPQKLIRAALEKAGYKAEVNSADAAQPGCFAVIYKPKQAGLRAFPFASLSGRTSDQGEVSCAAIAHRWIDSYIKASQQAIVIASVNEVKNQCDYSVYAVREPSASLPNAIQVPKLPD